MSWGVHKACRERKPLEEIQALIESDKACIGYRDSDDMLPFHWACLGGCPIAVLQYLLDQDDGWAMRQTDTWGQTPLHLACLSLTGPSVETLKFLIELDPQALTAREDDNGIPLHALAHNMNASDHQQSKEALEFLIQQYPEGVKALDFDKDTPLFSMCRNKFIMALEKATADMSLGESITNYSAMERARRKAEKRIFGLRKEMIAILVKAYTEALHLVCKRGDTPLRYMERNDPDAFNMMKRMETITNTIDVAPATQEYTP